MSARNSQETETNFNQATTMQKRTKIAAIALSVGALMATAFGQTQVFRQFTQAFRAKLVKPIPEVTYFNGNVGVEFQIKNNGYSTIGSRDLIVVDLDPNAPKLMGGVTDDRPPLSGTIDVNGTIVNLVPLPNGNLKATIPQSAINWFSGNYLSVDVYDGPPDANGYPTGQRFVGWSTDAYL